MKKLILFVVGLFLLYSYAVSAAPATEFSLNKTYELVTPAASGYPDSGGKKLTDGRYSMPVESGETSFYYKSDAYVGFNQTDADANGCFVILLDLGEVTEGLARFEASVLNETDVGIFAPKYVKVEVSDSYDGTYTSVGIWASGESTSEGISKPVVATVSAETPLSGRYVRFTLQHLGEYVNDSGETARAGWVFVDEISVYGEGDTGTESSGDTTPPATGDLGILPWVIIGAGSALIFLSLRKSRRGI